MGGVGVEGDSHCQCVAGLNRQSIWEDTCQGPKASNERLQNFWGSKNLEENLPSTTLQRKESILLWRMIARGFYRCARCKSSSHTIWRARRSSAIRSYTTSSTATASTIAQSPASILGTLTTELDKLSPRFELQSSQIQILKSPVDFYESLKVRSTLSVLK